MTKKSLLKQISYNIKLHYKKIENKNNKELNTLIKHKKEKNTKFKKK